jgi:hypothetical protein
MGMRDRYPDPQGNRGVETVLFNSLGFRVGKIGPTNFDSQWRKIRQAVYDGKSYTLHPRTHFLHVIGYSGGGTQVMSGWNMIKNLHFELHGQNGKAWYDEV